jgi:hypothetical protein
MAHFAEIDTNNNVINVIVINDEDLLNDKGIADETLGVTLCHQLVASSINNRWVQTSYSGSFRGNFGSIGMEYDETLDIFREHMPLIDWTWVDGAWKAPD